MTETKSSPQKDNAKRVYKPVFPIVLKNSKEGMVCIVYRNRVEMFGSRSGHRVETKAQIDKASPEGFGEKGWTPEAEVEMAVGNGFKRVHDTTNDRWDLWDCGNAKENPQ